MSITCLILAASTAGAGEWRHVTQGDCPGPQLKGSAGETPDPTLCTPSLHGKTALCFPRVCNPGCQIIDTPTTQCRGGAEMAEVYTCVATPAGQ